MVEYRAVFDAELTFLNGGGLQTSGFRLDVPDADISQDSLGTLFVRHLGLLMVDQAKLTNVEIVEEAHRGSRGGPSEQASSTGNLIELNHVLTDGMITFPGLPGPEICHYLTYEQSREHYTQGTEFAIDRITLVSNTGTYVEAPLHRHRDGVDLADLPLSSIANLPVQLVRVAGSKSRGIEPAALATLDIAGAAVLLHTGWDQHWGTETYGTGKGHFLTEAGAQFLADRGAALVGIDSVNIDDMAKKARPSHTVLLGAGIPVLENLTGLDQLPMTGARLHAAPPRVRSFPAFTVRAYAVLAD